MTLWVCILYLANPNPIIPIHIQLLSIGQIALTDALGNIFLTAFREFKLNLRVLVLVIRIPPPSMPTHINPSLLDSNASTSLKGRCPLLLLG